MCKTIFRTVVKAPHMWPACCHDLGPVGPFESFESFRNSGDGLEKIGAKFWKTGIWSPTNIWRWCSKFPKRNIYRPLEKEDTSLSLRFWDRWYFFFVTWNSRGQVSMTFNGIWLVHPRNRKITFASAKIMVTVPAKQYAFPWNPMKKPLISRDLHLPLRSWHLRLKPWKSTDSMAMIEIALGWWLVYHLYPSIITCCN